MKTDTFLEKTAAIDSSNGRDFGFVIPPPAVARLWERMVQFYCTPSPRASRINHLPDEAIAVIDKIAIAGFRNCASRLLGVASRMKPRELLSEYLALSQNDKAEFLNLLGEASSAVDVFRIAHYLHPEEGERYVDTIQDRMCELFYPFIFHYAQEVAKERPELSGDEFNAEVNRRASEATEEYNRVIGEREAAKFKEQRDRKGELETAIRNVRICDLWKSGRSQKSLAREFVVSDRMIRTIISKEGKWRGIVARSGLG